MRTYKKSTALGYSLGLLAVLGLLAGTQGCAGNPNPLVGNPYEPVFSQVDQRAEINADERTVTDIVATFNRAERAILKKNLDALMDLYSDSYRYHGLRKDDVRKLWARLFDHYETILIYHLFTSVKVQPGQPPTAELICTGYARGNDMETGWRVRLDSWVFETHHLVLEDGVWRIRGHADEPSSALEFGSTVHPLF